MFGTEFAQSIDPVIEVSTKHGSMLCRGGHGRLLWRARSFHEEEPETLRWLDELDVDDVLWDVGANVGMYSLYAGKFRGCRVVAFEPEAQNYALLVDNFALNGLGDRCFPVMTALYDSDGFGYLDVRYVTKGGAYNHFTSGRRTGRFIPLSPPRPLIRVRQRFAKLYSALGWTNFLLTNYSPPPPTSRLM